MVCITLCCMIQMDQANSCVDAYKLEILRLNAKLRQHLITQQEILGAFYDFIESKLFDPANEKHLGLQATVAALDLSLQVSGTSKIFASKGSQTFKQFYVCLDLSTVSGLQNAVCKIQSTQTRFWVQFIALCHCRASMSIQHCKFPYHKPCARVKVSSEASWAVLWGLKWISYCFLIQSAMQDQGNDIDELRDTLKKITEDLLASNKRIDELEARLSEQEYLRLLGDGIFELRTYVAVAMGFDSWASLATRLMLEKHYAVKPTRAQMAPILQQMGLDLAIWDSMTAVASQRNDRCHPGSSATSSHLLHCQ